MTVQHRASWGLCVMLCEADSLDIGDMVCDTENRGPLTRVIVSPCVSL